MRAADSSSDAAAVTALKRVIADTPKRPDVWVRASEKSGHVGAVLADAALQPGLKYRAVVEPRVKRVEEEHRAASTVSGLLFLLESQRAEAVLRIKNARKCDVFRSLALLLREEGVETADQLRLWLDRPDSRSKLVALHGVGPKTAAYLRLLVGLPAIAVDVHLRRAAISAGVKRSDEDLERLYTRAAQELGLSLADLDGSLWQRGADQHPRRAT